MRKIAQVGRVKVYRNAPMQEYVCKLPGRPEADYFTDDRDDAMATARAMDEQVDAPRGGEQVNNYMSQESMPHAQWLSGWAAGAEHVQRMVRRCPNAAGRIIAHVLARMSDEHAAPYGRGYRAALRAAF